MFQIENIFLVLVENIRFSAILRGESTVFA